MMPPLLVPAVRVGPREVSERSLSRGLLIRVVHRLDGLDDVAAGPPQPGHVRVLAVAVRAAVIDAWVGTDQCQRRCR